MAFRRIYQILILAGVLLCLSMLLINIRAQQLDCSDTVKTALQTTGEKCAQIGRNKACYGNGSVVAEANAGVQPQDFIFHTAGDVVGVDQIKSLRLASYDPNNNTQWGVVYLHIQANLPGTAAGQYVTMLLYGDAQLQNSTQAVSTAAGANGPLGAVFFQTGAGSPTCHNAPTSGLLIQTPPGAGKVSFTVNGVRLGVSSTVFIQAPASDLDSRYPIGQLPTKSPVTQLATFTPLPSRTSGASHMLRIVTLQGHVSVSAGSYTKTVSTGQQTDVTLNDQGDQPSDVGDPIQDVTTIDSQDNPGLTLADETGDTLLAPLPTDEATSESQVTDTPEITDTPVITDTPESPVVTDTPESNSASSGVDTPTPEQAQASGLSP